MRCRHGLLEKAILGEPNSISIKRQLARALFQSGDTRKANLILTGNFHEDSSDTQSMTQLSENLISEGNLVKANFITNRIIEIKNNNIHSKCGWSPFDGYKFKGSPVYTIISGHIKMKEDEILGEPSGKPILFD